MTEPRTQSERLEALDYLRVLAAISVWAFHWLFNGIRNGKLSTLQFSLAAPLAAYGYLGVHLFFLISGFVIVRSMHGKSALQFVTGRAARLYPAYWSGVLVTSTVLAAWPSPLMPVRHWQVVANLTMVPALFRQLPVDGVYWTLVVELKFYAFMFVLLIVRADAHLRVVLASWSVVMLAVSLLQPAWTEVALLGNYFSLFSAGASIALLRQPGGRAWSLLGLGASYVTSLRYCLAGLPALCNERQFAYSAFWTVVLITLSHFAIIAACSPGIATARLPASAALGGLTYPVYLLHAHLGYTLLSRFGSEQNKLLGYLAVGALVLGLAQGIRSLVETRYRDAWRNFFENVLTTPVMRLAALLQMPRR